MRSRREGSSIRCFCSVLVAAAVACAIATAWAAGEQNVRVYAQGRQLVMRPAARVQGGVTYVPLRAAAEAVGGHVSWDAKRRVAVICTAERCVSIPAAQGIVVEKTLLVPLRLLGEALGRSVSWEPRQRIVQIR